MRDGSRDSGRRAVGPGELVLGLDLGTQLGWAVLDSGGRRVASGIAVLRPRPHAGQRWRSARIVLAELLARHRPRLLAYEDVVRHQVAGRPNFRAAQIYGAIQALTLLAAFEHDPALPVVALAPAEVKQAATRDGSAKKGDMVAAACWRWGVEITYSDEADGLWTAWAALQGAGHAPGVGHSRGARRGVQPAA